KSSSIHLVNGVEQNKKNHLLILMIYNIFNKKTKAICLSFFIISHYLKCSNQYLMQGSRSIVPQIKPPFIKHSFQDTSMYITFSSYHIPFFPSYKVIIFNFTTILFPLDII